MNVRGRQKYKINLASGSKKKEAIAAKPSKIIRIGTVHKTKAFTAIDQIEYVPKLAKSMGRVAA